MIRGDLSSRLIHLTRSDGAETAEERFLSIIADRSLRGSAGGIRGGHKCVCFSEAPVSVLAQILAEPADGGFRYAPFGVMVDKV